MEKGHVGCRPYDPPSWCHPRLTVIPKCRVKLCVDNTPIHEWKVPGVPKGFQLFVKREDLTGSTLSGNKVRKLEFLVGDALDKGCDCLITSGGIQSNHCRATAIAGKQFGLDTHMFLMDKVDQHPPCIGSKGNLLLCRLAGASFVICPPLQVLDNVIEKQIEIMEEYAAKLRSEGHKPYIIPPGGYSTIGSWGYIDAWQEMMKQGVLENFDDIFLAAGSTGCACGLAVANYLTGSKVKIHAVTIGLLRDVCYRLVDEHIKDLGLIDVNAHDILEIVDGYVGLGYGKSSKEEQGLIVDVVFNTGLSLDPTFTAKAFRGMITEMNENPTSFKGRRVLFIHTGGIFGLYDGTIDKEIQSNSRCNKIQHLNDVLPNNNW